MKKFSRKDAKTQSKTRRLAQGNTTELASVFASSFAPLRLCVRIFFGSLLLLAIISTSTLGQNKSTRFDPDGSYWLHSQPAPAEFSDFSAINLNAKKLRRLPSPGLQVLDGTTYRFKTLNVKQNSFTFTTVPIKGVSYGFSGRFLKGGDYSSGILDDETPVLEGTLTKFRGGKKLAEAKLKFIYFGGT